MNSRFLKLTAIMGALMLGTACSATRTQQSAGEVIDDSVLTAKVKAGLIDDPVTKAGQINVETYRGVVQLGGFVDNAAAKNQATVVARSVTGVKEVRNDLEISSPQATTGQVVDDSTVTASVKTKLIDDSTTKAHQINVETQKGVVQLTGFVNSNEAKARAADWLGLRRGGAQFEERVAVGAMADQPQAAIAALRRAAEFKARRPAGRPWQPLRRRARTPRQLALGVQPCQAVVVSDRPGPAARRRTRAVEQRRLGAVGVGAPQAGAGIAGEQAGDVAPDHAGRTGQRRFEYRLGAEGFADRINQ